MNIVMSMVKKMRNDFCIFILSHGRADRIYTLDAMRKHGYTGKWYIVIDNEDKTANEYYKKYGKDKVLMFDKLEASKKFDQADNFEDRRAIVYARNVCFDLAEKLGIKYFIEFDDDYTCFDFAFDNNKNYIAHKSIKNLDNIINIMLGFFINTKQIKSISMSQGGDFIGGENSAVSKKYVDNKFVRKCMNSFICSTDRKFSFIGRINEDVNTYTSVASLGNIFLTLPPIRLEQKTTQSNEGGMTDIYLESGTYIKSFYTVIFSPSSVDIRLMGAKNKRFHHNISWKNAIPQIISENYKK